MVSTAECLLMTLKPSVSGSSSLNSSLIPSTSNLLGDARQCRGYRLKRSQQAVQAVLDVRTLPDSLSTGRSDAVLDLGAFPASEIRKASDSLKRANIDLEELMSLDDGPLSDEAHCRGFLQDCRRRKAVGDAFNFVMSMPKPTLSAFTQLIGVCSVASDFDGAKRAFQLAKDCGLSPDCALYTSFITACCKTGKTELAFMIFHEMEGSGVAPNEHTYGVLIHGCVKARQVAKAFGVFGIMISKKVVPDRVIFHSLMTACGKVENLDRAFDILQDMKTAGIQPDCLTMTLLLDVCTKCKKVDRALGVYRVLRKKGAATSASAFTSAINACSVTGSLPTAKQIYADMKNDGVKPDELVYCALIKVASEAEDPAWGFSLLQEMKACRVAITTKTYNSLMNMCCQLNLADKALEVFQDMLLAGSPPDILTFNPLLQTLCKAGRVEEALGFLDIISTAGLQLDHATYMVLIKSCSSTSKVATAFKLYHAADLDGKSTNLENCNSMLDLCYAQIRTNAAPPSFSFTAGRFSMDPRMRLPRQQWAMCALNIYRQTVTAGVRPTVRLLSKMLGCLRKSYPTDYLLLPTANEFGGFTFRAEGSLQYVMPEGAPKSSSLADIYESHAVTIYEEAASMGVVPLVSGPLPSVIDLQNLPSHAAEVCMLSFLRNLVSTGRRSTGTGKKTKMSQFVIKVSPQEATTSFTNGQKRKIVLAGRTAQAVTSLLRRLGLSFSGRPSTGRILITHSAVEKWIQSQPGNPPVIGSSSAWSVDSSDLVPQFGQSLAGQQRAIRMGAEPKYNPAAYYSRRS